VHSSMPSAKWMKRISKSSHGRNINSSLYIINVKGSSVSGFPLFFIPYLKSKQQSSPLNCQSEKKSIDISQGQALSDTQSPIGAIPKPKHCGQTLSVRPTGLIRSAKHQHQPKTRVIRNGMPCQEDFLTQTFWKSSVRLPGRACPQCKDLLRGRSKYYKPQY